MRDVNLTGLDIGGPAMAGATRQTTAGVEILAGGADIWNERDEFHFAYARVAGDFEVDVRLQSLEMADLYTKAGLMLRASLDDGAPHAFLLAFGDNQPRNRNNGGIEFQYRAAPETPCTGVYPPQPLPPTPAFPVHFPRVWLKLTREQDLITSRFSEDGINWRTFSTHRQPFAYVAYVGLAVTSHHPGQTVKAVFGPLRWQANVLTAAH